MISHVVINLGVRNQYETDSDKGHCEIGITLGDSVGGASRLAVDQVTAAHWHAENTRGAGQLARLGCYAETFMAEQRRAHGCVAGLTRVPSSGPLSPPDFKGDDDICQIGYRDILQPTGEAGVYLYVPETELTTWQGRVSAWLTVITSADAR